MNQNEVFKNKNLNFTKRVQFAIAGIHSAFKQEKSLRLQYLAALILFLFCVVTKPPALWCALFIAVSALVICLEMVNSGLEATLDKLFPQYNNTVKYVKDCVAGCVLIASLSAVAIFAIYIYTTYLIVK